MQPTFFDIVEGRGLFTLADQYLEIPIKNSFQCSRSFRLLPNTLQLERISNCPHNSGRLTFLRTALKIVSYMTLVIPAIALLIKAIGHYSLKARVTAIAPLKSNTENGDHQYWSDRYETILKKDADFVKQNIDKCFPHHYSSGGKRVFVVERHIDGSFPLPGAFDPTGIPFAQYVQRIGGYKATQGLLDPIPNFCRPSQDLDLPKRIKAAFAIGKEVVSTTFDWNSHCRCLGISNTGRVCMIDPIGSNPDEFLQLLQMLNDRKITDKQGRLIRFHGEEIGTHLQQDSYNCVRLSYLYALAIALTGDVDGWQRIHGALLDGKLKTFGAFDNVLTARKVLLIGPHDKDLYLRIIRSIQYRSYGLELDDWREVRAGDYQLIYGFYSTWEVALLDGPEPLKKDWPESDSGVKIVYDPTTYRMEEVYVELHYITNDGAKIPFSTIPHLAPKGVRIEPVIDDQPLGQIRANTGERVYLVEDSRPQAELRRCLVYTPANGRLGK